MTEATTPVRVFQPILPKLSVTKIETTEQVKEIGAFLRAHSYLFIGLPTFFSYSAMRVRKEVAYIPAQYSGDTERNIFAIGDYLVVSENGARYFTKEESVKHGVFRGFPAELFVPIEGEKLDEPSFV